MNYSYEYIYDNSGNITAKKRYAFTTGTLGTVQYTYQYQYDDTSWGDLLTSYDGLGISYDEIGNPTRIVTSDFSIPGEYTEEYGYVYEWNGRQLLSRQSFDNYGDFDMVYNDPVSFTYNADGIRTSRTVNGHRYNYLLNGSQIIGEKWSLSSTEYRLLYIYDETGSPIGIQYRTSAYAEDTYDCFFFEKNLQGDIVAIYNANGRKIGSYVYDAWGNFSITTTSTNTALENSIVRDYNPFRYRGYYYDKDLGWYYLQSRYYNPQWGRFINADGYVSTGQGLLSYNMFAYCNNNPVMNVDPTGEAWGHWVLAAAVVVACVAATVVTCGGSLAGAAMAIGMVASGSAALTTASTVAAAATIGSGMVLGAMALDAAFHSDSLEEFGDAGNTGTIVATTLGGLTGGGYGYSIGRNINSPTLPKDSDRLNHIFQQKEGHISDTTANRKFLTDLSKPKNYVGTDQYGNYWYSKVLDDETQAWSVVRNGIIWDGGINQIPKPWNQSTGYKKS